MLVKRIIRSLGRVNADCSRFGRVRSISNNSRLVISPEVKDAMKNELPIVALESTIITHGMPYPQNVETAKRVEDVVRKNGAVPATIAIIDGVFKVGLEDQDVTAIADVSRHKSKVLKASRRDLAYIAANKLSAGTTVAATMILASMAGIRVFATGGIGGVHRGAESTMDVSADLFELGKTPVCVVCAGAKSILDIPKTLEVLESHGVPSIGYKTQYFPAFFTTTSGVRVPMQADSTQQIGSLLWQQFDQLALTTGVVVGVPNPEPFENEQEIEELITKSVQDAASQGISGSAITPYLLSTLEKATKGNSLKANVALILNNAKVASQIAVEYNRIRKEDSNKASISTPIAANSSGNIRVRSNLSSAASIEAHRIPSPPRDVPPILIIGGAVVDTISTSAVPLVVNTSNPGITESSFGGVARNIAEGIAKLQSHDINGKSKCGHDSNTYVSLVSVVGDDSSGHGLLEHAAQLGIDVSRVLRLDKHGNVLNFASNESNTSMITANKEIIPATATYTAIHDKNGDLAYGIADMRIFDFLDDAYVNRLAGVIRKSRIVVADGNITSSTLNAIASLCSSNVVPLMFEPTSKFKCLLPLTANCLHSIDIMKPNVGELVTLVSACLEREMISSNKVSVIRALENAKSTSTHDISDVRILANTLRSLMQSNANSISQRMITAEGLPHKVMGKHVFVSMGSQGVLWSGPRDAILHRRAGVKPMQFTDSNHAVVVVDDLTACQLIPPIAVDLSTHPIINANGAGDAFCAGLVNALYDSTCTRLDYVCVQAGMQAAYRALTGTL